MNALARTIVIRRERERQGDCIGAVKANLVNRRNLAIWNDDDDLCMFYEIKMLEIVNNQLAPGSPKAMQIRLFKGNLKSF